jgi:hypothetical protein
MNEGLPEIPFAVTASAAVLKAIAQSYFFFLLF